MFASAAHADSMYTITLHNIFGNVSDGTGSFTLNEAPGRGNEFYQSSNSSGDILKSLSFSIGGDTFALSNASSGYGAVGFYNGNLDDITYEANLGSRRAELSFSSGSIFYNFEDSAKQEGSSGYMSVAPAAAVTPEPSCLALLGTGLLTGVGVLRRRMA